MKRSEELRVQPVKRYRKPKYPSHEDPDPVLNPRPVPYPIGTKVISAIAASASVLATSCTPPADSGAVAAAKPAATFPDDEVEAPKPEVENFRSRLYAQQMAEEAEKEESGEVVFDADLDSYQNRETKLRQDLIEKADGNPLCVAISGLPHQTSAYGTGVPNYIDSDLARRTIEKIFAEEGFDLKASVQYDTDGVAFVMDGYDAKRKLGFVFGDYENLDRDALKYWWLRASQNEGNNAEVEIGMLEQEIRSDASQKPLLAEIASARKQPDPAKRDAAYKAILKRRAAKMLSLAEIQALEKRAKEWKDFVAFFSMFDERFATSWGSQQITELEMERWKLEAKTEIARGGDAKAIQDQLKIRIAKQKAETHIGKLEKAARDYIQWAKTQGLQ